MLNITEIKFFNRFRTEPVIWTLANVGDKIRTEITFEASTYCQSSSISQFILNNLDGYVGDGWVTSEGGEFADFKVGDTVTWFDVVTPTNTDNTLVVVAKKSDNEIQFNHDVWTYGSNVVSDGSLFTVTVPITSVRYLYNFVENSENPTFNSKTVGTEQQLLIKYKEADDISPEAMVFIGEKSYQTGSATIQGVSIDSTLVYTSTYKIIHETMITPLMLSEQWDDLKAGILPDYFFNSKCLKGIFDIKAARDFNDPNWIVTESITETLGNTGGLGENFNNGITNYSISGLVIKNVALDVLDAIELTTNETSVEFIINNSIDTPFLNNNTKFELQLYKAPFSPSEYTQNGRTLDQNFIDDRALQTVGSAAINGEQFGVAGRQALKDVDAVFLSTSQIKIRAKIKLLSSTISIFTESEEPRYVLTCAVQDHTLESKLADLVRLPVDVKAFYINTSDPTMIVTTSKFLKHTESNLATEGSATITVAPEDEVVAYSGFYVDKNGRSADVIKLVSITAKVKSKNSITNAEFDLDKFTLDASGFEIINNNQFVNFEIPRNFHIPTAEIRRLIKIKRRDDLDNSDKFYYDVQFPYLIRWEYFLALAGVNGAFFNTSQPKNGFNNNWYRYATALSNWGVYYEMTVNATKNGVLQQYPFESIMQFFDYDSNPDWNPNTIKSYDIDTNAELYDPILVRKYIQGFKDTKIEASFTKVSATPVLNDITVNMGIEVYEKGGVDGRRRMSTIWASPNDTWFKSLIGNDKTQKQLTGNTVKASLLIDSEMIPLTEKVFKITARLYEPPVLGTCVKSTPTGGTAPFTYTWYHKVLVGDPYVLITGANTDTYCGIVSGEYYKSHVEDANGCITEEEHIAT